MIPTPEPQRAEALMAHGPVWLVRRVMELEQREKELRQAVGLALMHLQDPRAIDAVRMALATQSEESDA